MIVISYDISDTKLRAKFSKLLTKQGAIRLQYSVYEIINTNRIMNNLELKIKEFSKAFSMDDSVVVFSVKNKDVVKYGNAIHRDKSVIYF